MHRFTACAPGLFWNAGPVLRLIIGWLCLVYYWRTVLHIAASCAAFQKSESQLMLPVAWRYRSHIYDGTELVQQVARLLTVLVLSFATGILSGGEGEKCEFIHCFDDKASANKPASCFLLSLTFLVVFDMFDQSGQ